MLVILDGSSRDLGTSYELINNVIIPNLGEDKENRILVAINQADMAMKGRNWDFNENKPNDKLKEFLEEKVRSVKNRIYEGTGVSVEPIYYSAGYKEEGEVQNRPYNLSKLLYYIVKATPANKRVVYVDNINSDESMWKDDDELLDYGKETRQSVFDSIVEGASEGADVGERIGGIFGTAGKKVGRIIGGAIGAVVGFLGGIFG